MRSDPEPGDLVANAEAEEEIYPVLIVKEDGALLKSSDDDVMKQSGDISMRVCLSMLAVYH